FLVGAALKVDIDDTLGRVAPAEGNVGGGADGRKINVERRQGAKVGQSHLNFVVVQEVLHQVLQRRVERQRHRAFLSRGPRPLVPVIIGPPRQLGKRGPSTVFSDRPAPFRRCVPPP